jgi:6-phosphogluconolactonase (cycloisomerase 2 family)
MHAFVGSRTTRERDARGDGISVFRMDDATGHLDLVQVVGELINPSYLAVSGDGRNLYAVHGDMSSVSSFAVDASSGRLRFLNRQETGGSNPVHLAIDPSGRFLLVSNHLGSSLAVLPIGAEGSLRPVVQLLQLEGPIGPHRVEQTMAKPHYNPFDPSGRFVLVPDKGTDRIFAFEFVDGALRPAREPFVATREGAGPRHLAFHPDKPFLYVANELDSTVTAYRFNPVSGGMTPLQRLSSLPEIFTGDSRSAAIFVHPAGHRLYASNRGHDSIAVFDIDPDTGLLGFVAATPTQGAKPRAFAIAPSGRWLFAMNEGSDTIVRFRIDASTGRLHGDGIPAACGSPVCMVFSS